MAAHTEVIQMICLSKNMSFFKLNSHQIFWICRPKSTFPCAAAVFIAWFPWIEQHQNILQGIYRTPPPLKKQPHLSYIFMPHRREHGGGWQRIQRNGSERGRCERSGKQKWNTTHFHFNTLGVKLGSKIRWELRQANRERENLQMSDWGRAAAPAATVKSLQSGLLHQVDCGTELMLFTVRCVASQVERNTDEAAAHPCHNLTLWTRVSVEMFHTDSSHQWENWCVVINRRAMHHFSYVAHAWEHLIAHSQLPLVDRRQHQTERQAEETETERERERAWVKVIIWITAGNWITLHRGKLIGQQWVELWLDRWVHILHTCQWAVPVGFQLRFLKSRSC